MLLRIVLMDSDRRSAQVERLEVVDTDRRRRWSELRACRSSPHMSVSGVRRAKAALSIGCKPHPAIAPAGSNRSSHGGNEVAEAFEKRVTNW
jgi:hypothetical protein